MQINEFDLKNKSNDFETLNLNDKALIDSLDLDNETDNTFDNNKKTDDYTPYQAQKRNI